MSRATRKVPPPVERRHLRVLIVDDHPVVRHGFGQRIAVEEDMTVCGEAATAAEALDHIDRERPDVALVDLRLATGNGLDLIKDLATRDERVRILVISGLDEDVYAERCLRAGARGYLHKAEAIDRLIEAIRRIADDGYYLADRIAGRTLRRLIPARDRNGEERDGSSMDALSDRELQVHEMTGHGMTVKEIAAALFLSPKTVETHRAHIKKKLGLRNATELTRHAVHWVIEHE